MIMIMKMIVVLETGSSADAPRIGLRRRPLDVRFGVANVQYVCCMMIYTYIIILLDYEL